MKRLGLLRAVVGMLFGGPVAAIPITLPGATAGTQDEWNVELVQGTFYDLESTLELQPYWGSQGDAYEFAAATKNYLRSGNYACTDEVRPGTEQCQVQYLFAFLLDSPESGTQSAQVHTEWAWGGFNIFSSYPVKTYEYERLWSPTDVLPYALVTRSVPEPTTLLLLSVGLPLLLRSRRR